MCRLLPELEGTAVPISAPGPAGRNREWGVVTVWFLGGISLCECVNGLPDEMG